MSDFAPEDVVQINLDIPQLSTKVELHLNLDDTVWDIKKNIIKTIASNLENPLNYGFFLPSSATKAAKYLDEDRTLREYNLRPGTQLQLIVKRRIYKTACNEKKLREINSKSMRKKFLEHLIKNVSDKVEKFLTKGFDPNFVDPELGECPFTLCVTLKSPREMISCLIGGGAHLDYRNKEGWTSMHKAAKEGHLEALQTLLNFGASANYRDLHELTPLYLSVINDVNPSCVKELLKNYALLGIRDEDGETETHQACKRGNVQHLDLLITYGADVNCINNMGNTPLHICAMKNQEDGVRLLLFRGADKTIRNNINQSPQDLAAVYKHAKLVDIINSFKPEDIVYSSEVPTYNEKSRLTLKRGDKGSLLLSKMNKLSTSTPYLHQSVSNLSWECFKKSDGRNSIKSCDSTGNSTGSADQQFESDADVTTNSSQESRSNSLPNHKVQTLTKSLREGRTALKVHSTKPDPPKIPVVTRSNGNFSRQLSADNFLKIPTAGNFPADNGEKRFSRRQSYGGTLESHEEEDIYMNDSELEQQTLRRHSAHNQNQINFEIKTNESPRHRLPNNSSEPSFNAFTLAQNNDTYLNSFDVTDLVNDRPTPRSSDYRHGFGQTMKSSKWDGTPKLSLPPLKLQPHNSSPRPNNFTTKAFSSATTAELNHLKLNNPTQYTNNFSKHSIAAPVPNQKTPAISFIPPPPVFPSTFRTANSSVSAVFRKMSAANSEDNGPLSPPLPPPPPIDFTSDFTPQAISLPPPPPSLVTSSYHQYRRGPDSPDPQSELLAAILKRRNHIEQ